MNVISPMDCLPIASHANREGVDGNVGLGFNWILTDLRQKYRKYNQGLHLVYYIQYTIPYVSSLKKLNNWVA